MRVRKFNLETDKGVEMSVKLLPNIDNMKEPCKYIEKYYEGSQEVTKNEYWNARQNGKSVMKYKRFAYYALVNGEYCIIPLSETLAKFIGYAIDGAYYKVNSERPDGSPSFYSLDEFEERRIRKQLKEAKILHLLEKVVISTEPINMLDIKNDWSLKFTIEDKMGFVAYKNIRLEKDEKNLIWDGNQEKVHEVQKFLNDKDLILDGYTG